MNALRDLGYVGLFVFVLLLCFTGVGHCQDVLAPVDLGKVLIVGDVDPVKSSSIEFKEVEFGSKQHFWQRHPTRTKVLFMAGGFGLGILAHILTTHNCPKIYDGKPYDGTPPCPK